jgi:succinate dehydrogenase/fumarate reductase flavoprotein subunit
MNPPARSAPAGAAETRVLAEYLAAPPNPFSSRLYERAKDLLIGHLGAAYSEIGLPWSQSIRGRAFADGGPAQSTIHGLGRVGARNAARAGATAAQGIERDGSACCDVIVVGAGASGLTAAIVAGLNGLTAVVLEKAPLFGGISAIAGGGLWIACNPVAARAGLKDSIEAARTYFKTVTGNGYDSARVEAFLANGPNMVRLLEEKTAVRFNVAADRPDYYPNLAGGTDSGRTIFPVPFDGRKLGKHIARLRPPARELTFLGAMIRPGPELRHFVNVFRSFQSARIVARKMLRHARDVIIHGRPMELSNGNALVARLAKSAIDLGIPILTSVGVEELILEHGRVAGVRYNAAGKQGELRARRGVVLASGGFSHDLQRRREQYRHAATGAEHLSPAPETNTGDGMRMAEQINAFVPELSDAAAWVPVSKVPWGNGKSGVFPHLIDRQKPGFIAVTRHGRRFVNESDSYHEFGRGLIAACRTESEPHCFLIADHRTVRRYGIGFVKPAPIPLFPYIKSGYLVRAPTLRELADRLGIESDTFVATVTAFNDGAKAGRDPLFKRGESAYNRYNGDPLHKPNPCIAPVEVAPFYAVRIVMGELGTFAGLATDERARVLDKERHPIPGLYAVGNDMSSVMAGNYLGGGSTLGPGMTFAYIAANDLASGG